MTEKVTVEEKDSLYNKVAKVINQMIPGQKLDMPIQTVTTTQPVKYNILDGDGNVIDTVDKFDEDYKPGRKVYRNDDGSYTYNPTTTISLDESTGKITVKAPDFVLNHEGFKDQFGPQLETLSRYYQQSPMSTIPQADGSYKTIPQIINELNDPDNPSSLPKYTEALLSMQDQELGFKDKDGNIYEGDRKVYNIPDEIKLNDDYFMLRNTIAIGDGVTDSTLQAVPKNLAQADFLRSLQSYDKDTGTVQYKDLMDNAYNLSVEGVQNETERLKELKAGLEEYFAQGDYTDTDEFARSVALYEFITHKAPNAKWYQTVAYTVGSFIEGVADYGMNVHAFSPTSALSVNQMLAPYQAIESIFSSVAESMSQGKPAYKSYVKEYLNSEYEFWRDMESTRKQEKAYLVPSAAAAQEIGYSLASLATLIAAGNAAEGIAKEGVASVAGKAYEASHAVRGISAAAVHGTNSAAMVHGMKTIVTVSKPGTVAKLANIVSKVAEAKATSVTAGLVAETFAEAITGNPDKFYRVMNSGDLTDEAKAQLWEDFIGNSVGLASGVAVGKGLIRLGETTYGRAISHNIARKLAKVSVALGDEWEQVMNKIHGVESTKDYIQKLNKGEKTEKALAIELRAQIREMKRLIADSDSIKIIGRTEEEILEDLDELDDALLGYRAFENAVDEFNRKGQGIAAELLNPVLNKEVSSANEVIQETYEELRKAENATNISGITRVGQLAISQETTNYIAAILKRDIVNSAISVLENNKGRANDVYELKKELEKANSVITNYQALVGNNQDILQLARKHADSLKDFYAKLNNVLMKKGFLNNMQVQELRESGLWGENGELYVHFQRLIPDDKLSPLQFAGNFRTDTVEYIKSYVHGSDLDYMDPLVTSRLYVRRAADKLARQEVVKQYITATGTGQELLNASDTEASRILSASLQTATKEEYKHAVKAFIATTRESVIPNLYANILRGDSAVSGLNRKMKTRENTLSTLFFGGDTDKAKKMAANIETRAESYNTKSLMMLSLPKADVDNVWNTGIVNKYGKGVTLYKYLKDNYKDLPRGVKTYLRESMAVANYASSMSDFAGKTFTEFMDTDDGVKYAWKQAFMRNGINKNMSSADRLRPDLGFLKGMKKGEIKKVMTNIFGEDVAKRYLKAITDSKGRLIPLTKSQLSDFFKYVFYEPNQAARGTFEFTKTGQRTYDKMIAYQKATAVKELVDKNNEFSYKNWMVLKKSTPDIEDNLKRRLIAADKNGEVFDVKDLARDFVKENIAAKNAAEMVVFGNEEEKISSVLGIAKEELNYGISQAIDGFINEVYKYPATLRAFDELIEYYGLDKRYAYRYLALRTIVENEKKILEGTSKTSRERIGENITNQVRRENADIKAGHEKGYVKGRLDNLLWKKIHAEYDTMRTQMHEIAPAFVDEGKMYDEVNKITEEIRGYRRDADNIVAINDGFGRVSYFKTDPLLASMVNHSPVFKPLSRMEKANYLLSKTFRLGTTSLNLKSLVNQTFRDFGNAFIGGNLYRTWSMSKLQMQGVLGENVVDWIRRSDSDLAEYIVKTARDMGKTEEEVAYATIKEIGKTISPSSTETDVYKRAVDVNRSINSYKNKGIEKLTTSNLEGVVGAIDTIGNKLGWANELREGGLRNLVFQNGFADAVKRGYSFDKAKEYATFLMNNATTNFGRTSVMFSRMQRTVPFLGAAINGTTSFYRLLSVDPVGVIGRLVGGIILPMAYLTSGSLLTAEDRKKWRSIKEYEKDSNIVFISNGQIYSIPIPQEIAAWVNPIRHIIEKDADANIHSITQLAINDILGLSPVDLDGFLNIDASMMADGTDEDNFFINNIEPGIAKLFSQIAPVSMKASVMWVTGIDPYTMKKIDKTYTTVNPDTGEVEIMGDYSSTFAKIVSKLTGENKAYSMSAPMAEKLLGSIIGAAPVEYAGWLCDIGEAIISKKDVVDALSSSAEGVVNMVTGPITVPQYKTKAEEDWKAAVSEMYDKKQELLMSDAWQSYQKQKRDATTAEQLSKLSGVRDNLTKGYYEQLQAMVNNLQTKYEADFTAEKYAAIISLSVLDQTGVDSTAYGQNLSDELYKDAKNRAVDTMYRMGFDSPSDYSVFGYLKTGQDGAPYVAMSTPMAILQLRDNMNYAKGLHQANMGSILESRGLQKNSDAYRAMQNQVDAIYSKGNLESADYDAISAIYKQWDAQVMAALYPYLRQYGLENVLENSDTVEFLNDVIKVPSDFAKTKQGRYFSSPGLNKQAGYAKAYIEYVYNLLEEQ